MAEGYSYGNDPKANGDAAQQRDVVRLLSQDKKDGSMRVSDAEITYLISAQGGNLYGAAADVCDLILSQLGVAKSKRVGQLSIDRELSHYQDLRKTLRRRARSRQTPFAGGLSFTDKAQSETDSDAVQPAFSRGLHERPETTSATAAPTDPLKTGRL